MALPDFVPLLSVVVPSVLFAAERIVKHVLRFHERLLDHQVECRVVEKEGSEGLLNLAELERARRRKRLRWPLRGFKGKANSSEQKSLPP